MRVEWNGEDALLKVVTTRGHKRLVKAARIIKAAVRRRCPVGTISRPMYRKGPYRGQPWTSTDKGRLRKSVRIVERDEEKYGFQLAQFKSLGHYGSVRVYVGHYLAWYAQIVEFYTPFIRPAVAEREHMVKSILEDG